MSLSKILYLIELQFFLLKIAAAKWFACARIAVLEVANTGEHFTSEYIHIVLTTIIIFINKETLII